MTSRSSAPDALARRQQALVARSAELRGEWAAGVAPWRAPMAWIDRMRDCGRWLRRHPEWPAALIVLAVVARPRHTLRWGMRLWSAWRLLRPLLPVGPARARRGGGDPQ